MLQWSQALWRHQAQCRAHSPILDWMMPNTVYKPEHRGEQKNDDCCRNGDQVSNTACSIRGRPTARKDFFVFPGNRCVTTNCCAGPTIDYTNLKHFPLETTKTFYLFEPTFFFKVNLSFNRVSNGDVTCKRRVSHMFIIRTVGHFISLPGLNEGSVPVTFHCSR